MIPTSNRRNRTLRSITALATVVVMTSGCGALIEKATEKAVEEGVERAIEADSGGDVEIDFSENGIQIDGTDEDGNDFSFELDEDGLEVESEGEGSLDIDSDGTFVATDEDGNETVGGVNEEDGSFTVESEDGDTVFRTGTGFPDEWPSDIPKPSGLSDINGSYMTGDGTENIIISGILSGDSLDGFDDYADALIDAGFNEESKFTQGDSASGQFLRGERSVSITVQAADGDASSMSVVVS